MRNSLGQFVKGQPNNFIPKGSKRPESSGSKHPNWKGGKVKKICPICKKKFEVFYGRRDIAHYCSPKCKGEGYKGKHFSTKTEFKKGMKLSKEHYRKMSESKRGKPFSGRQATYEEKHSLEARRKRSNALMGEKSPTWKGGIYPKNKRLRESFEYKEWRKKVFKRDNWTCQECNIRGGILNADHIKPFSLFSKLRLKIDNGRTLCRECHRKTDTFGYKKIYRQGDVSILGVKAK